ncbi:hypothetical protein L1987_09279 [Smallanthus sonchifolius]|uniref:Uncharacterized protein n=1 Tax=Smallanthus sonchifolius TaxID=185202 RepID=A0ACB9JMZ6_9ASTR|nr:hypothetical protein L1987_09279 [Smallanthus sonchifolius]
MERSCHRVRLINKLLERSFLLTFLPQVIDFNYENKMTVEEIRGSVGYNNEIDRFPIGMRVLAVDDDLTFPISVIASMKKIKSCITNNNLLAQALRSSSKLVVSNDGKKVRRKHPVTEKDKEELQSVLKTRKSDFDGLLDDDDDFDWSEVSSQPNSATSEPVINNNIEENSKKGWARGYGKLWKDLANVKMPT